jgi:hypothetical protein
MVLAAAASEAAAASALAMSQACCQRCGGWGMRTVRFRDAPCGCVWRAIFRACLERYRREEQAVGRARGELGYHSLTYGYKGAEFCADFELAARRALNAADYKLFRLRFVLGLKEPLAMRALGMNSGNYWHRAYRVEELMGRTLAERKLYPTREYFSARFATLERPTHSRLSDGTAGMVML